MENVKEQAKRLITLFMKVNLKMIFIMDMVDIFMQMVIIIQAIGEMVKEVDGEDWQIRVARFMKECGS